ncbi:MAG: putative quinol monooxygenase [Rhizomicrobium sp.]
MLVIIGTIRLPAENLSAARSFMATMVAQSRAEAGCLAYAYAEDVLEAGLIRITEVWEDQASLDRHLASDHLAAWRTAWPTLAIGERNLVLYEVGTARRV